LFDESFFLDVGVEKAISFQHFPIMEAVVSGFVSSLAIGIG
jgi:hypothetical protein